MAIFLQDGKYRIEKSLGQGGFGITYLATQVNLNRQVAIKEFYPKDFCDTSQVRLTPKPGDEELVARFKRKFISEARNVAKLDHPNIVKIYDVFEENSTAYFVMEYVEGESLDAMSKRGAMSEADALHYIIPIARALEYVHSENMTHLDVKPANIMVRRKNNTPVLIDFGLAKQYDRTTGGETSTSFVGLSPGYAPIEQYNQGGVNTFSPQIDVYALGATLYRLVTGITPPEPTMREGQDVEITAPVSAGTRSAISHAMRVFKNDRTPSMTAFLAELSATQTPAPQPIENNFKDGIKPFNANYLIIIFIVLFAVSVFLGIRGINSCSREDIVKDDSVALMVEKAEQGDAESQFLLGEKYFYGRGVRQDYFQAKEWFFKAAEQGYVQAQYMVGQCYENGYGFRRDWYEAVVWYRKAAEQGDVKSQYLLGEKYFYGRGIVQDFSIAIEWFLKAAEQGYAPAQYMIGHCYEYGDGFEKSWFNATGWYGKAAEQGYAPAQVMFGYCNYRGYGGLEEDEAKAVEWYRKAAEQGYSDGQYQLALCYKYGWGIEKDYDKAIEWFRKAAKQGHKEAVDALKRMGIHDY